MITRAQAEALLTPAESLEARERLGLAIEGGGDIDVGIANGDYFLSPPVGVLTAVEIRLTVNKLTPTQEQSL